jgi:acyl-CoA synthetase (AMP-forming)/AMP-acid ligase II
MARALLAAGMGKGSRIGLLAPDGLLWLTTFLAGLRIGAVLTAMSTLCTPRELAHMLKHSDCQLLVAARYFLNHDYTATLEAALELDEASPARLYLTAAPYLRTIYLDTVKGERWAVPVADLLAMADEDDAPGDDLLAAAEREVAASDDAVIVYTSGSTAQPKAVVHRQWTVARHPRELAKNFAITADDRMMPLLPSFWMAGMSTVLQVLSVGGTVVYPASPAIDDALDMIERFAVTRVNAWGDKQPRLIEAAGKRGLDIAHIPELSIFRDRDGRPVSTKIPMYGMTESFSAHSASPVNVPLPCGREDSFGLPINGYERRVVDIASGEILPLGSIGELQIRGPALMSGLYKLDRQETFTADGFYPTRDLASIDEEGWLYPAGRIDDMIKSRGANVSRLEVEAALNDLPGIKTAVVTGLPHPEFGAEVVAAVVPVGDGATDEAAIQAALRATLSSFKIPRRIVFISEEEIPRTATGKLQLSGIADMIAARIGK